MSGLFEFIQYVGGLLFGSESVILDAFSMIVDFVVMIPTPMLVLFSLAIGFFILRLLPL